MAQNMFQGTDIPLGVRVEFFHKWSEWIKHNSQPIQTSPNPNEFQFQSNLFAYQDQDSSENIDKQSTQKSTQKSTQEKLNLNSILNSNIQGKNLLIKFKETKIVTENLRKLLCESVLQYCIENDYSLTVHDCESLANQICVAFPGELTVYHHFQVTFTIVCSLH